MNLLSETLFLASACWAAGTVCAQAPCLSPIRGADVGYRRMRDFDDARWVWAADPGTNRFFRFRAEFSSDGTPLDLSVSADERYVLLLDGEEISRGPARGMPSHWFCQRVRARPSEGAHRLEAVVWVLGEDAPKAQLSAGGGFFLKARGAYDAALTTGRGDWKVAPLQNTVTDRLTYAKQFGAGTPFRVRGASYLDEVPSEPYGPVKTVDFPIRAVPRNGVVYNRWKVFESTLPEMMRRTVRPDDLPRRPFVVPAGAKREIVVDLDDYYCAYPDLVVSGGRGSTIRWGWAEALVDEKGKKLHRDDRNGLFTQANFDTFLPDDRPRARFTVPWWRCGKWCRLEFETGAEPLTVEDIALVETRYPLEAGAVFEAEGDDTLADIGRLCARGVGMCAHELMFDCPFYEQQMYPGDILMSFAALRSMTRDTRLSRQSLELLDAARSPAGLVPMNWPSRADQRSTTFSLAWIVAVGEQALWGGEDSADWLKDRFAGVTHTLVSLRRAEDATGLLVDPPGWNFLDWAKEWMSNNGMPPNGGFGNGPDANVNLLYLRAMESAAMLAEVVGDEGMSACWRARAVRLASSIRHVFWSDERGLIADTPDRRSFSELAQAQAIVSSCLPDGMRRRAFEGLCTASDLARAANLQHVVFSAYFSFGRGDLFLKKLDQWRAYVRDGLHTPLEAPAFPRSDCHAFASTPLFHFHSGLAGVRPLTPLFAQVLVKPAPGGLRRIRAKTPHPKGWVVTDLSFNGDVVSGTVALPEGVSGRFEWRDRCLELKEGGNDIAL